MKVLAYNYLLQVIKVNKCLFQWMAIGVRGLVGRHVQNLVTEARVDGSGAVTILLLLMVVKIVREEQNEYKHVMKTTVQV